MTEHGRGMGGAWTGRVGVVCSVGVMREKGSIEMKKKGCNEEEGM